MVLYFSLGLTNCTSNLAQWKTELWFVSEKTSSIKGYMNSQKERNKSIG